MALERILEPEVMDVDAEARAYNEMDHGSVNRQFVSDLLAFHNSDECFHDILDVGTGTALIPVELCFQYADCRVMAMDASSSMLDLAVYNVEAEGLAYRITLAQGDAGQMIYQDDMFDGVISNSLMHHLAEPKQCLSEMLRVVRGNGLIFVRDLMRPDSEESVEQLVREHVGQESEVAQQLFRQSLHAALTIEEVRTWVSELGVAEETVQETSDRHWTWACRVGSV